MTNREREYAAVGVEYAEGIDRWAEDAPAGTVFEVPRTGRDIRKTVRGTWECNPWNDNYWKEFDNLLDAIKFATPPAR